jgi:RimJ/RimL family protein N-acetyltransferase
MHHMLLRGEQVRLAAPNPETDAETIASWSRDSEFLHLLETGAPELWTAQTTKAQLVEEQGDERSQGRKFTFVIRTLEDERLIGFVDLEVNHWPQREGWLAIGIGRGEDRGKGYGTDAMRALARYAFAELNLARLSLNVFAYNEPAVRSYLKAGFSVEGRQRERLRRGARRYDMIFMGLLREDWLAQRPPVSD